MAEKKQTTYIILGDKVGPWVKGTAVHADQFESAGEIDRLIRLGAIGIPGEKLPTPLRRATPAEQVAYDEAKRRAFIDGLVPADVAPPEPEPPAT
jgi:hypothetical protein